VHRLDNVNRAELVASLQACLATNYYWFKREEQYYRIEPRLMVEGLIDDGEPQGPVDYRLFCFFGRPAFVRIRHQGMGGYGFFDLDWHSLDVTMSGSRYRPLAGFPRPSGLDEMVAVASALSSPFDFVRVDLYHTHEATLFGELTFTPSAGALAMRPTQFDAEIGHLWVIPPSDIEATARHLSRLRLGKVPRAR
jgi:hypothetical protein